MMSNPLVLVETSSGDMLLELFEDKAPATVANFLRYVDEEFYANTIFHRVISDFMIQGGGLTVRMEEKPTQPLFPTKQGTGSKSPRYDSHGPHFRSSLGHRSVLHQCCG